ncbi:uncharacterized protein LOC129923704 [Biomphalaria glabrata]|uniref:Uncharacterized protein LOC129923704 n=1 Tax=Biomphalaria glabrata TaxID=6526 RepID=A0A9W2ZAR7_BIOGL|nr:uncharacterized protein LOC129923704 [Biomphalaria glabrata]XP_055872087.1 uncharacterized protein LOC129923704 [Biomphalaria glabrata]
MDALSEALVCIIFIHGANSIMADQTCDPDVPSRAPPKLNDQVMALPQSDVRELNCPEGEYLEFYKCLPCKEGTFRTKQMAALDKFSRCQICQKPGMHEYEKEACSRTKDTLVMCVQGYYRHPTEGNPCDWECKLCKTCGLGEYMFDNFVARDCNDFEDVICCKENNTTVVNGQCVEMTTTTSPRTQPTASSLSSATSTDTTAPKRGESVQRQHVGSSGTAKRPDLYSLLCSVVFNAYQRWYLQISIAH